MDNPVTTTTDPPSVTTDPPVTTTTDPPVTTTTVQNPTTTTHDDVTTTTRPPPTRTTTWDDGGPTTTRPRSTKTTTPYTTSYITTMTMTWTRVPRTTHDISGRATTIYIPVTTYIPTVIPDPAQPPPPPPPSDEIPDTATQSSGMTTWQIILVVLAAILVLFAGMAAIFVGRLKKKKDRLEDERRKREALLEGDDGLVDIDDLAIGRMSGHGWKDGGGGGGGGGARPGSEMTTNTSTSTGAPLVIAAPMRRQHSMEHFRGSVGDEYALSGANAVHRPSMSNSSEGAGALMMLDEYSGAVGACGPYYYDYYGYSQDPAAFQQQQQQHIGTNNNDNSNHQRRSYPLPPPSMTAIPDPYHSRSHDQYADGYGHGVDVGTGTSTTTVARNTTTTTASSTPFLTSQPLLSATQQILPPVSETSTFGTPISSDLDRHPSTGNQTTLSNTTASGASLPVSGVQQFGGVTSNTPTATMNANGSIVVGGRGGGGTVPGTTMSPRAATPLSSTGTGGRVEGGGAATGTSSSNNTSRGVSRDLPTNDYLMYVPATINNPHTEYVAMQPTGVYAPSAPSSPQMMQMGRTHLQDPTSGAIRRIEVDPAQLEAFAKEENRRQDPHALLEHQSYYRPLSGGGS